MRRFVLVTSVLLCAAPALAEPYIAVREGLRCSACHINMNGGGKRTDLVSTHARDLLHYPNFFGAFSNPPEFFGGEINRYVALGADLRASNTAVFQDQGSNGRVSNDQVFRGRLERNRLDVTEALVYGELRLIPDYLTFYLDQRFQPQTDNREAFGVLKGALPWKGFIKAGRMFLPYGLQLQDDGAFIRGGTNGSANTGFSFNQQQAAFEIGFEPGPLTLIAAVSDGPAGDRDVQVTATAYTLFTDLPVVRNVLAGGSFSRVGPPGSETMLFGFFAGSTIERLTVLGEADFRSDRNQTTKGRTVTRFIAYGEGDYPFWGATEDLWIGPLWPRGRARKHNLSKAGPDTNWSGAKGFLDYRAEGCEVNIQLADVYPCCPMTCRPVGSLLTEPLIDILDRCARHPVYRSMRGALKKWGSIWESAKKKASAAAANSAITACGATSSSRGTRLICFRARNGPDSSQKKMDPTPEV